MLSRQAGERLDSASGPRARARQRGSSSSSADAREKRVPGFRSAQASSMATKPSRAALTAARFSATSVTLRACTYSWKHAFFSPSVFSAEYLRAREG